MALGAVVSLLTPLILGADIHVLRDVDRDGLADPCPNAAHRTHYATATVTCGSTFDIDGDGSDETIHCDLQLGANAATGPGDSLEIHDGDWGFADTTPERVEFICDTGSKTARNEVMLVVRACPACSSEADRRFIRAAEMNGAVDTAVRLDPGGCTNCSGTIVLGVGAGDNVTFTTLRGLIVSDTVYDVAACVTGENGNHFGAVQFKGNVSDSIVEQMTIDLDSWNSSAECRFTNESSVSAFGCTPAGNCDRNDRVVIRDNTTNACGFGSIKCGVCNATNNDINFWEVHDNRITGHNDSPNPGTAGNISLFEFKGFEHFAFYNNWVTCTDEELMGKLRVGDGDLYWFNNVFDNCVGMLHHQGPGSLNAYLFNNTVRGAEGKGGSRVVELAEDRLFVHNNSMLGDAPTAWGPVPLVAGNEHFQRTFGGSPATDRGGHVCTDAEACGQNGGVDECLGTGGCDPVVSGTAAAAPFKIADPASVLRNAGGRDPLGQGPGNCFIQGFPSSPIDCTRDRDGQDRNLSGASWDIGADEYDADAGTREPECRDGVDNDDSDILVDFPADPGCVSADDVLEFGSAACDNGLDDDGDGRADLVDTGCSGPADPDENDCGDGVAGGAESCDGNDFSGRTCATLGQGFTGGTLACTAACGFDTGGCTGTGGALLQDDFAVATTLVRNWDDEAASGVFDVITHPGRLTHRGGNGRSYLRYVNPAASRTATEDQWCCLETVSGWDDGLAACALRAQGQPGGDYYAFEAFGVTARWSRCRAGSCEINDEISGAHRFSDDDWGICARVEGTGAATQFRGWVFSSDPGAYAGDGAWDAAATRTFAFEGPPTFAVDSGRSCGLHAFTDRPPLVLDDWACGDLAFGSACLFGAARRCESFDATGDGKIDGFELAQLGRAFGQCSDTPAAESWTGLDYDADGCIDGNDLALLASIWGCREGQLFCR
jgi:hypothetical protein